MAEYTGSGLYVKFGSTVLSSRFKSWEETQEAGLANASAGADTMNTYLSTLDDGSASLELLEAAVGTALFNAVAPRTSGTLEWGPEGTTSGKPKYTVVAIVKSRKRSVVHDDVTKLSIEFQFNSSTGVTPATY